MPFSIQLSTTTGLAPVLRNRSVHVRALSRGYSGTRIWIRRSWFAFSGIATARSFGGEASVSRSTETLPACPSQPELRLSSLSTSWSSRLAFRLNQASIVADSAILAGMTRSSSAVPGTGGAPACAGTVMRPCFLVLPSLPADLTKIRPGLDTNLSIACFGAIEIVDVPSGPAGSLAAPHQRKRFHVDRVLKLFHDPVGLLRDVYQWGAASFDGVALFQERR